MSKKVFKKEYKNKDGETKVLEYEYDKNIKTHNEQLSENVDKTIKSWLDEGYIMINDIDDIKEIPLGTYVRYLLKNGQVRKGGYLSDKDNDGKYMMLLNKINGVKWSVQYENLKSVFIKKPKKIKVKVNDKKNDKEEDDDDSENDKKNNDEVDKILREYYYDKKNFVSADKLYKRLRDDDIKITRKQVRDWLARQELFQLTKNVKNKSEQRALISKKPFGLIYVDLIDFTKKPNIRNRRKYNYLLTAVDNLSKYGWAIPIVSKEAINIKKALEEIVNDPIIVGSIGSFLTDNGKEFKNKIIIDYLKSKNIKHIYSIAYNPNSNLAEVFNKTLKNMLYKSFILNNNEDWINNVDEIVKNYNRNYHSSIKHAPIDVVVNPDLYTKVYNTLLNKTRRIKSDSQLDSDDFKFNIGDKVRLVDNIKKKIGKNIIKNTTEIFVIVKKIRANGTRPERYKVKSLLNEDISGYLTKNELIYVPEDTYYFSKE